MTVWAQESKIPRAIIAIIAILMVYLDRNLLGGRIYLVPPALLTLSTSKMNQSPPYNPWCLPIAFVNRIEEFIRNLAIEEDRKYVLLLTTSRTELFT